MCGHFCIEGGFDELWGIVSVCFLGQLLILFQEVLECLSGRIEMKLFPFAPCCGYGLWADVLSSECGNDIFQAGAVRVCHVTIRL